MAPGSGNMLISFKISTYLWFANIWKYLSFAYHYSFPFSEEDINFLLKQALLKLPFIPFSYIVDKWRWSVFSGRTEPVEYNRYWWELRKKYQGISIPKGMNRNDDLLCDPGTFFHVAHNTEYLRYFMSHILQFQFHKALCDEAGVGSPYHKCSIYKSKRAGEKLR